MEKQNKNNRQNILDMVLIAMFAVIIAVCSWLSIPGEVPVTLQTFGVFCAVGLLGGKRGTLSVVIYILLGLVGVPVFAGWSGGFSVIVGYTGGFIYGFIVMALLCGLGAKFCSDKISGKVIAIVLGIAGLACDHLLGAIQYAIVANISIGKSILLVSVPYLVKDVISVVAAYLISIELVSRLAKTGCYAYKRA